MNIEISKRFVKDTQKITDKCILAKIQQILIEAKQIESLTDWANVERLSGFSGFYRITTIIATVLAFTARRKQFSFYEWVVVKVFIRNFHNGSLGF